MDQEMQDNIDVIEYECRRCIGRLEDHVALDPQTLLDIFAAFRLEIIKAGGRNA